MPTDLWFGESGHPAHGPSRWPLCGESPRWPLARDQRRLPKPPICFLRSRALADEPFRHKAPTRYSLRRNGTFVVFFKEMFSQWFNRVGRIYANQNKRIVFDEKKWERWRRGGWDLKASRKHLEQCYFRSKSHKPFPNCFMQRGPHPHSRAGDFLCLLAKMTSVWVSRWSEHMNNKRNHGTKMIINQPIKSKLELGGLSMK